MQYIRFQWILCQEWFWRKSGFLTTVVKFSVSILLMLSSFSVIIFLSFTGYLQLCMALGFIMTVWSYRFILTLIRSFSIPSDQNLIICGRWGQKMQASFLTASGTIISSALSLGIIILYSHIARSFVSRSLTFELSSSLAASFLLRLVAVTIGIFYTSLKHCS